MISSNEEMSLITRSNDDIRNRPRSHCWQICQNAHYIIGSICFTAGSCMYFTDVFHPHPIALTIGGWLFTIGSFIFLLADLQDWWDYRTGYCFDYESRSTSDIPLRSLNSSVSSDINDPIEIEINTFGSICGSAFYLAGSILFLPIFEKYLTIGEWFFIFGSTFCYLSLIWKLYRLACKNSTEKFHLLTLLNNKSILTMNVFSLIGNICFFIGTILFLSYINETNSDENRAASFFVFGSLCFILSSSVPLFSK